jgi:hypothetical protein
LATQKNSDEERRKVAEKWSKVLNVEIKPEQINCDGCLSGKLFFYCSSCDKRKCCLEKHIDNCSYCEDYPCDKLESVFKAVPQAKVTLDEMRRKACKEVKQDS